jgi:2-amino-4-hydroxy-6-hydroxymethyldihydropteridine diphosphokinase
MSVVIALGSNLGDRREILESAIEALREYVDIKAISSLIETDPVGGVEQPDYLNGVLIGETTLSPEDLMQRLLEIEAGAGRERTVRWGARTLDLDLIAYGDIEQESEFLTLPHPRAHERAFVLAPWFEIDPDATLPGKGLIRDLLSSL